MGKKVRKKARSSHKEKRVTTSSTKAVPQENDPSVEIVDDEAPAQVEKARRVCVHLEKAVDLGQVCSRIESSESTGCEDCREGMIDRRAGKVKGKHAKKKGASDSKSDCKATWVCLQCGHFSCGGVGLPTSPQSHAIRHARQSRHPLVIQVENPHLRWCFSCSTLIPIDKLDDTGEQKDVLSDIVKLLKKQSSKGTSVDVEDIWFGSGSVVSELKSGNKEVSVVNGKDYYDVRGLVNLGNTCFFNSVMQNLLAIDILREYLSKFEGSMGPLTSALKKVFVETRSETGLRNVINPRSLFGCVCAKAPQFRGYQQQDSHELLRCLLDGLSTEDLCAKKSDCSSSENGGPPSTNSTFVDSIFGGQLSSTVCCVECGHSSVVYEPFLDLSLPVPTKKPPSKKAQSVSRTRKTKLPPKRGARTRSKLSKDGDPGPALSSCNPSTNSDASFGLKGASLSCSTSPNLVKPVGVVDGDGLVSQNRNNSTEDEHTGSQESQSGTLEADGSAWLDYLEPVSQSGGPEADGSAWLDFLEPVSLADDGIMAVGNEDIVVSRDSERKDENHNIVCEQDTAESSGEVSVHPGDPNLKSESGVDGWGVDNWKDECPVQVQDNEILLLTYKEDSATAVEGMNIDTEISSSVVGGGEDMIGFDGLGDLFNEPEVSVSPSSVPNNFQSSEHMANGFLDRNYSESDPDEVDNSDSPVCVESCLAHFIKPEFLSDEHAWHCENCSKLLQEERRKMRKNQMKTTLIKRNSSSEALQARSHPSSNGSTIASATYNSGSSDPVENLKKLDTRLINELCPTSPAAEEESCESENVCVNAAGASVCFGPFGEASMGGKSVDSPSMFTNCVPVERLSGMDEEHESGSDKEEEVDSESVKVPRNATKRILIEKAPPILTIHLKRFAQDVRGRLSKLNGHVGFKEYIDLGPYMDRRSLERDDCIYRLVGVVEHSGSMRGGHYVAYVRGGNRRRGKSEEENRHRSCVWYHTSDAYVRETNLEEVLRCEAYILFYEKVKS